MLLEDWNTVGKHRKENLGQMANGGGRDPRREKPGGPGQSRRPPKDNRALRPSSSGVAPATDMDSLREAVSLATAGTGEVRRAIRESTFQPRAAAFTSLIQQCARTKAWQKALEVFEAMQETPGVKANFINYSALISACSTSGRWQEAESAFSNMLAASQTDPECCPNTITYSSLITACERGGRLDRALDWYQQMQRNGVDADYIIYSSLIAACERASELDQALQLLDSMHAAGFNHTPELYAKLIERLGASGQWERALDLFLTCQMAGAEATKGVCLALLSALETSRQPRPALQLLDAYRSANSVPDRDVQTAALRVCARAGDWKSALRIWERLPPGSSAAAGQASGQAAGQAGGPAGQPGAPPGQPESMQAAGAQLVLAACRAGGDDAKAAELAQRFKGLGISL